MPRQKQVLQENPILSKASPNINCTLYGRTASKPKNERAAPKAAKVQLIPTAAYQYAFRGEPRPKRGAGGALDPESQAGRSG